MQTIGPETARIMLVGDFPTQVDMARGTPFTGAPGAELAKMLHEAGLTFTSCFSMTLSVISGPYPDPTKWVDFKKKPSDPSFQPFKQFWAHSAIVNGMQRVKEMIRLVKPNVVVALGPVALLGLAGEWGTKKWRGSVLQVTLEGHTFKVIPTYGPDYVLRDYSVRATVVQDLRRVLRESGSPVITVPNKRYIIRPNFATAVSELSRLILEADRSTLKLSCDIETRAGHMECVGFARSSTEAICIPLMAVGMPEGYWDPLQEQVIRDLIKKLMTHPNVQLFGQNFIYDAQYFWREFFFVPRIWFDTMLAQHCMFPGTPKGLDYLASLMCRHYRYWKDDGKESSAKLNDMQRWAYNCDDCTYTYEIMEQQWPAIERDARLHEVWNFQQNTLVPRVLEAMIRGVRVNKPLKQSLSKSLEGEIILRNKWLETTVGRPLNIQSTKQMTEFFYDELALKPVISRKTGSVTTDDEALRKIGTREPALRPAIRRIQELRSLNVFKSTFVEARLDVDGRMRSSYNVGGTETFRLSSSENAFGSGINFQNIPAGTEADDPTALQLPNIRKLYVPDPGYTIFDTDLDRADLQVVVWEADDDELRQALAEGVDLHSLNAKTLFGLSCPIAEVKKRYNDKRQTAKAWVHGTNYGGGPRTMAQTCGLTVHEAERLQRRWFEAHPGIKAWHDRTLQQLQRFRWVENRFGYRYTFFGRVDASLPEALAWIPQSTVACVINRIWDQIMKASPQIEVLIQVHDSLVGQFPTAEAERMLQTIRDHSTVVIPYDKPLIIPSGIKTSTVSWGDCQ